MGYYTRSIGPIASSFVRARALVLLYCVSAVLGIGFLGFMLFLGSMDHAGMAFQQVLVMSMPFTGLLLFVSCAVTTLEFARQVFGMEQSSLFRVRHKGEIQVSVALLATSVCLWMATLAISLIVVVAFSVSAGISFPEIMNILEFVVLRLGGATLVATLLGLLLGKTMSRTAGHSLIVAILVLISPVVSSIVGSSFSLDTSYPVRLGLYWMLIAPFELTAPMYNSSLDSIYLLPSEPHQWLLPAIWVAAILIGLALSSRKNYQAPVLTALLAFVLMIAPWAAYGAHIALPRMSHAPHDITAWNLMADLIVEGASGSLIISESITAVDEYRLDLTVGSMLSGNVTMVLDEPFREQPVFTLFRGYRVSKITDGEGRSLDFRQEGDHVTVLTPMQDQVREFVFEYSGSGWGNYANQQGVFLPGSFPWYPWPGKQRFYWFDDTYQFAVSNHIPRRGTVREIRVRVRSPFREIHTPQGVVLTRSDSFVSVPTESLTLIAGQVGVVGDEETFFVYGGKATLDVFEHPGAAVNLADRQTRERILDRARSLRKVMGLDSPELFDVDTVVIVPTYPRYSNLFIVPVYQNNYVLIAEGYVYDYSVLFAMEDIPQHYAKRDVYEFLYQYLNNTEDFLSINPGTGDVQEFSFSSRTGNLFADLVRDRGEEYVLSRVAEYLMDDRRTESGYEFLSSLMEAEQDASH